MSEQRVLADVRTSFEYCYLHDEWVTPLAEALDGLTTEQALHPACGETSIWQIVLHMAVWNENIVERVLTGENVHPSEGAWPPLPGHADDAAWSAAQQRLWDSLESLEQMLASASWSQVESSPYGLPDILCRLIHNAYHIGQITKMRPCTYLVNGRSTEGRARGC